MRRTMSGVARALAIITVSFLLNGPANAGELSLLLNGKAFHLDPPSGSNYNEKNWGVGVQYDLAPTANGWVPFLTAAEFRDSNKNISYYAGGGYLRRFDFYGGDVHVDVGGVAFLMVRKDFRGGDPFPGVLPVLSVGAGRYALNFTFIPKVDPKMVPIVFVQFKLTLGSFD